MGQDLRIAEALAEVVRADRAVLGDPEKLAAALAACPDVSAVRASLLAGAVDSGVASAIAAAPERDTMLEARLAQQLVLERRLSDSDARWIVDVWAEALHAPAAPAMSAPAAESLAASTTPAPAPPPAAPDLKPQWQPASAPRPTQPPIAPPPPDDAAALERIAREFRERRDQAAREDEIAGAARRRRFGRALRFGVAAMLFVAIAPGIYSAIFDSGGSNSTDTTASPDVTTDYTNDPIGFATDNLFDTAEKVPSAEVIAAMRPLVSAQVLARVEAGAKSPDASRYAWLKMTTEDDLGHTVTGYSILDPVSDGSWNELVTAYRDSSGSANVVGEWAGGGSSGE